MGGSCLAERFNLRAALSRQEEDALKQLEDQERVFRRGSVVISENAASRELFVVRSGCLHSSLNLDDGGRQIIQFHFRGDIVGLPLLAFRESPETVTAVTQAVLYSFGRERLASLMQEHPRLSSLILLRTAAEKVSLADRLASIGRTSARARIASLICEFVSRSDQQDDSPDGAIQLPLTQEEIGDATGLTAVHVNRMMRGLVEEGIIERSGQTLRVLDPQRLCDIASFADRSKIEPDWLPPAK